MPKKLRRKFPCIIYHPREADSAAMRYHVINCVDYMVRKHPNCGVLLTGAFDKLNNELKTHYRDAQLVLKVCFDLCWWRLNIMLISISTGWHVKTSSPFWHQERGHFQEGVRYGRKEHTLTISGANNMHFWGESCKS